MYFREDEDTARLEGLPYAQTELLIRPVDVLPMQTSAGGCDDYATLTAAMLLRERNRALLSKPPTDHIAISRTPMPEEKRGFLGFPFAN